jgi:hypothetical protein
MIFDILLSFIKSYYYDIFLHKQLINAINFYNFKIPYINVLIFKYFSIFYKKREKLRKGKKYKKRVKNSKIHHIFLKTITESLIT